MATILENILLSTTFYKPQSWVPGKSEEINRQINLFARNSNEAAMVIAHMICDSDGFTHTVDTEKSNAPYHGRGYIKLVRGENYKQASYDLFGDNRLISNPDAINYSVELCTRVSLWVWDKKVRPVLARSSSTGSFLLTTKAINRDVGNYSDHASKRYAVYCQAARMLGVKNLFKYE
ncbi:uncharacterized protein LOC128739413 [Sabethes cyaneus]|uniref:uncharacterized protein LOC128739413 n=1 Tax=Sabethes cyaneus TaxID=53552 RepID=UPI00237E5948|nr:uncharacterized protein LOC128739413 [Sabethes cyaneus]